MSGAFGLKNPTSYTHQGQLCGVDDSLKSSFGGDQAAHKGLVDPAT